MNVAQALITQPGIYDLDDATYHADPVDGGSLSSTEARQLAECPARFRWAKDHGEPPHRREFDFGHAAHALVLGAGADVAVLEFDDWRTKDARAARDEAHANGATPILVKDFEAVQAMAEAIRSHPLAMRLLDPLHGRPEQSLMWIDGDVWRRARIDWLPDVPASGRLIVTDYKSAADASTPAFSKAIANYGYHQQAAWYLDGIRALCGVTDAAFVFVVQEKQPPYLVNVIELDPFALQAGAQRNAKAIDVYRECRASGVWPGFGDKVEMASLPRWAALAHEDEFGVPSW